MSADADESGTARGVCWGGHGGGGRSAERHERVRSAYLRQHGGPRPAHGESVVIDDVGIVVDASRCGRPCAGAASDPTSRVDRRGIGVGTPTRSLPDAQRSRRLLADRAARRGARVRRGLTAAGTRTPVTVRYGHAASAATAGTTTARGPACTGPCRRNPRHGGHAGHVPHALVPLVANTEISPTTPLRADGVGLPGSVCLFAQAARATNDDAQPGGRLGPYQPWPHLPGRRQ